MLRLRVCARHACRLSRGAFQSFKAGPGLMKGSNMCNCKKGVRCCGGDNSFRFLQLVVLFRAQTLSCSSQNETASMVARVQTS